jgi:hypothetical protein
MRCARARCRSADCIKPHHPRGTGKAGKGAEKAFVAAQVQKALVHQQRQAQRLELGQRLRVARCIGKDWYWRAGGDMGLRAWAL